MKSVDAGSTRRRVLALILCACYTLAILSVTMWPKPVTEGSNKQLIDKVLTVSRDAGAPVLFDFHALQFLANIAMFVPFGFLLVLSLTQRRLWVAGVSSFVLTATIELVQQAFLPERFGDAWDVVANTAGGLAGAALATAVLRLVKRRTMPAIAHGQSTGYEGQ